MRVLDFFKKKNNAIQPTNERGFSNLSGLYGSNLDQKMFNYFRGLNHNGKYDNFYPDVNRIINEAILHLPYYTVDNTVDDESPFANSLANPNQSFPGVKVYEQIFTELMTHGHSDLFIWRKNGKNELTHFDKQYDESLFSGITLVSGYDCSKLSATDKSDIVSITYGANQTNVLLGYSPTQAAESWRKMQDEMSLHATAFARNGGMPLGEIIITARSIDDYNEIREKLDKKLFGAKNNGKILYSYKPANASNSQIEWLQYSSRNVPDYNNLLEFSDKKMTAAFGTPDTIKGIGNDANYATARVSEYVFLRYTVLPLVKSLAYQLDWYLRQRFIMKGNIEADIELPILADESLIKIQATTQQVALYDQKIAEGYEAQSIIDAYDLPQSFILLEKTNSSTSNSVSNKKINNKVSHAHNHANKNMLDRFYKNALTKEQIAEVEKLIREAVNAYSTKILSGDYSDDDIESFKESMKNAFGVNFSNLYDINIEDVISALVEQLGSIDAAQLDLSEAELQAIYDQYSLRVDDFTKSFTEALKNIEGTDLSIKESNADYVKERVVVNEAEHSRIVSELRGWTKAQEEFPVRITKTWHIKDYNACENCQDLDGTTLDVTALFVNNDTDEIYETVAGGLHVDCRCYCNYEVRKDESNNN